MHISGVYPVADSGSVNHSFASRKIGALLFEQMLKAGLQDGGDNLMSGGVGEQQFASFLTTEYARILANHMDLGLGLEGANEAD